MNTERMHQLAAHLRKMPTCSLHKRTERGYSQKVVSHSFCGTPACIAGHAVALARFPNSSDPASKEIGFHTALEEDENGQDLEREAMKWLGLTEEQAWPLFDPSPLWAADKRQPTALEAAAELERLAKEAKNSTPWVLSTKQSVTRGINCFWRRLHGITVQIITEEDDLSHRLRIFAPGHKGPVYEETKEHSEGAWNLGEEKAKMERLATAMEVWI